MTDAQTLRAAIDGAPIVEKETTDRSKWQDPDPLPNALLPVEPFDFELMPEALRPWVQDVVERIQCPPDFVGVTVMAMTPRATTTRAAGYGRACAVPRELDACDCDLLRSGYRAGERG